MAHLSTLQRRNGAVKEDENQWHKNNYMLYAHTVQCGYKEYTHLLNCTAEEIQSQEADCLAVYRLWTHNKKKKRHTFIR